MTTFNLMAFLPELVMLTGALVLFIITLGENRGTQARLAAFVFAVLTMPPQKPRISSIEE